jgi:hypothetical protein
MWFCEAAEKEWSEGYNAQGAYSIRDSMNRQRRILPVLFIFPSRMLKHVFNICYKSSTFGGYDLLRLEYNHFIRLADGEFTSSRLFFPIFWRVDPRLNRRDYAAARNYERRHHFCY